MNITMIGHSTVLMEAAGKRILTDPWFGTFGNPAYARIRPPARQREELTNVDLVLLSHNHFDHIDSKFLRALPATVPVLAPAASAWMTRLKGGQNVRASKTWQRQEFDGFSIMAIPAWHITFTVGYILEAENTRIYFAGDTYLAPFMERIGRDFRPDIALMPVTTFRIPMTMGESQAVEAVRRLSPGVVIPIHLGIQPRLPLMRTKQTPEGFRERLRQAGLGAEIKILGEGESWETQQH